ncbi:MAG: hypothetical protein KKE36_08660 [Actinobacteria bacterium]|nr:hypothetical protein [Actinomycetota bacterium]
MSSHIQYAAADGKSANNAVCAGIPTGGGTGNRIERGNTVSCISTDAGECAPHIHKTAINHEGFYWIVGIGVPERVKGPIGQYVRYPVPFYIINLGESPADIEAA